MSHRYTELTGATLTRNWLRLLLVYNDPESCLGTAERALQAEQIGCLDYSHGESRCDRGEARELLRRYVIRQLCD